MATTVTFQSVIRAQTDPLEQEKIYWSVFYNADAQPKLRKWLVKKGVPLHHVDDLESEMRVALFVAIHKYNHDKIPFEKYVWTEFQQILINWFISKSKRSGAQLSIDEMVEVHGDSIELNLGNVTLDGGDTEFDAESIFSGMTQPQAFIARCLYYNEWTNNDVREYLHMTTAQYHRELTEVRRIVRTYFTH